MRKKHLLVPTLLRGKVRLRYGFPRKTVGNGKSTFYDSLYRTFVPLKFQEERRQRTANGLNRYALRSLCSKVWG